MKNDKTDCFPAIAATPANTGALLALGGVLGTVVWSALMLTAPIIGIYYAAHIYVAAVMLVTLIAASK